MSTKGGHKNEMQPLWIDLHYNKIIVRSTDETMEGRHLDNFSSSVPKCLKDNNNNINKLCPIENQYVRCGSHQHFDQCCHLYFWFYEQLSTDSPSAFGPVLPPILLVLWTAFSRLCITNTSSRSKVYNEEPHQNITLSQNLNSINI